jgi:hypothetical protein
METSIVVPAGKQENIIEMSIIQRIHEIRGMRVMLDFDLAEHYGVETKRLKEAVRRNLNRFSGEDFMFQLTKNEVTELSRSQIASLNSGRGSNIKYPPFAFTELGVAMLSSVLNSEYAIPWYEIIDYFDYWGTRNVSKITCNLLVGMGLYYKLPYGDLLRFNAGVNLSFKNVIEGYYYYYFSDSFGTFAARNDFIYTQISYIHTLNWQKAKKYLKKQELSDISIKINK